MLLQIMHLDPSGYEWTVWVHGYEPVPTLDPIAPEELLRFTSCNRQCSCMKNGVKCISACENCKDISCKNCTDDAEFEEDSDFDP